MLLLLMIDTISSNATTQHKNRGGSGKSTWIFGRVGKVLVALVACGGA